MSKESSIATAWEQAARRVASKVNAGWWLQTLSTPLLIGGLGGACLLLLLRREQPDAPGWVFIVSAGALVLLLGLAAWLVARRRFESPETAMVRIEDRLRLRNGLSAARAGVAPWPTAPAHVDVGLQWNWKRVLIAPLAALAFLAASLLLPVSALPEKDAGPDEEPLAWKEIESDLDRLEQDEVVDESYLEEMREKLEELRAKEEEEWFSHASLEATDSLEEQHEKEIKRFERDLSQADRALGSLQKNAGQMPRDRRDQLLNQFDQALQGLQNGALKPNQDLLDQLRQLDPKDLGQLNAEQIEQLRQNLQKAAGACKECQGGGAGDEWLDELLDGQGNGQGDQPGGNQPGEGPGKGGVNRGPGHAPGVLGQEGEGVETGKLESLEAKDLSRSLPGDLLQLQDGEHEVDESPSQTRAGGSIDAAGSGGDRVWKESLDPDEQRSLKRFFE